MPSGIYRRTIRGIFFSLSSLIAICSGSVSPSKSTSTGAFILYEIPVSISPLALETVPQRRCYPPDLQSPCAQNSCPLVLGHVRSCCALLGRNLLLLRCLVCASSSRWSTFSNNDTALSSGKKLVWVLACSNIVHICVLVTFLERFDWLIWIVLWLVVVVVWRESKLNSAPVLSQSSP